MGTPPQGDLSSVGLEEGGIADQAGRLAILECARTHDIRIDDFIEATASGQASEKRRRLDELTSVLERGDRLVDALRRM